LQVNEGSGYLNQKMVFGAGSFLFRKRFKVLVDAFEEI
jgi:hypothetical protein